MIKVGSIWQEKTLKFSTKGLYILAYVGNMKVCLIDLRTGNRWCTPYKIKKITSITYEEMGRCLGSMNLVDWHMVRDTV